MSAHICHAVLRSPWGGWRTPPSLPLKSPKAHIAHLASILLNGGAKEGSHPGTQLDSQSGQGLFLKCRWLLCHHELKKVP